jgi:hypothetical protein
MKGSSMSGWSWGSRLSLFIPAFIVAVIMFMLWAHVDRQNNLINARITADEEATASRLHTSDMDACVMYAFTLSSYNDQTRTAYQAGPAEYDRYLRAIVAAANHAHCDLPTPAGLE